MRTKILFTAEIVLIGTVLFSAGVASAASTAATVCSGDSLEQLFCSTNLSDMLNAIFQLSITLGGILAMLRIGYAGFLYMGRADMWSSQTHAKEVFRDAIIGLLILLAIYLILNQINPDILSLRLLEGSEEVPCGTDGCVHN